MERRGVGWWSVAAGVLLAVAGAVWALQGAGVLGGSAMSNDVLWTIIGIPVAAAGALLAWRAVARRR